MEQLQGLARPFVLIVMTLVLLTMAFMQIVIPDQVMGAYLLVLGFFFGARTAEKSAEAASEQRNREPDIFRAREPELSFSGKPDNPPTTHEALAKAHWDRERSGPAGPAPIHRDVRRQAAGLRR